MRIVFHSRVSRVDYATREWSLQARGGKTGWSVGRVLAMAYEKICKSAECCRFRHVPGVADIVKCPSVRRRDGRKSS